ncbi:hypothetical protein [Micromonospora sp. NPDC003776]
MMFFVGDVRPGRLTADRTVTQHQDAVAGTDKLLQVGGDQHDRQPVHREMR